MFVRAAKATDLQETKVSEIDGYNDKQKNLEFRVTSRKRNI